MTQPVHQQWLSIAEQDLGVAKHLFDLYRPTPLEIFCYQCQQCAEKALKAMYVYLNIPGGIPRTHDLSLLMDQMHNSISISDQLYDFADQLTPFGIAARYPNNLNFDEFRTKQAIDAAEAILVWVKTHIV